MDYLVSKHGLREGEEEEGEEEEERGGKQIQDMDSCIHDFGMIFVQ